MTEHERFVAFFRAVAHSEAGKQLGSADIVVRFTSTDTNEFLTVAATGADSDGGAFHVYDGAGPEPDVTFSANSEVFDAVLRGNVAPVMALASGKIRSKGSIAKAMRMLPVFEKCIPIYRDIA